MSISAQSTYSSNLYLKSFHQELLKFKLKNQAYYKESFLNEKHSEIIIRHKSVLTQLQNSKQKVLEASSFKKDDMLKTGYLHGINELIAIYQIDYAKVEKLRRYKSRSYEDLQSFYNAFRKAEHRVFLAEQRLIELENRFASRFKARRTTPAQEKALNDFYTANKHRRDLDLLFAEAHHMVNDFIVTIEEKEDAELSELELQIYVSDLQAKLKELRNEVDQMEENEISADLKKETLTYLKRSYKSVKKVLPQVAETFVVAKPNSKDTQNARVDLNFFAMDYNNYRKSLVKKHKAMASLIFETTDFMTIPSNGALLQASINK
jgi:uncharacterized coiled-coil protein SlyX